MTPLRAPIALNACRSIAQLSALFVSESHRAIGRSLTKRRDTWRARVEAVTHGDAAAEVLEGAVGDLEQGISWERISEAPQPHLHPGTRLLVQTRAYRARVTMTLM